MCARGERERGTGDRERSAKGGITEQERNARNSEGNPRELRLRRKNNRLRE